MHWLCGRSTPRVPGMVAMSQQPMMMPTAELDTPMWSHSLVTVGMTCGQAGTLAGRPAHAWVYGRAADIIRYAPAAVRAYKDTFGRPCADMGAAIVSVGPHQVVVRHVQARVDAVEHQAQWRGDGLLICGRRLEDARLWVTMSQGHSILTKVHACVRRPNVLRHVPATHTLQHRDLKSRFHVARTTFINPQPNRAGRRACFSAQLGCARTKPALRCASVRASAMASSTAAISSTGSAASSTTANLGVYLGLGFRGRDQGSPARRARVEPCAPSVGFAQLVSHDP